MPPVNRFKEFEQAASSPESSRKRRPEKSSNDKTGSMRSNASKSGRSGASSSKTPRDKGSSSKSSSGHHRSKSGNRDKPRSSSSSRSKPPKTEASLDNSNDDRFFKDIEAVKKDIKIILENSADLAKLHSHALTTLYADEAARTSEDIEDLTIETDQIAQKLRLTLQRLGKENEKMANDLRDGTATISQADLRIRTGQVQQLGRKMMDAVTEYQTIQSQNKDKYSKELKRQYKAVKPDATAEELDKLAAASGSSMMSQQLVFANQKDAELLLDEMQDRHNDIMVLEKSIVELHQLFMDMALLVEQQGDMVNSIAEHVEQAAVHTEQAVVELRQAVVHQKSSRKKKWCIIGLVCLLLIGAAFLLIWNLAPQLLGLGAKKSSTATAT